MALRFHWMLPKGGEIGRALDAGARVLARERAEAGLPDLAVRGDFCRRAEESGIDSVLLSFSYYEPDTIVLATALGLATQRLKLIVAYRSGLLCPTSFVQQINTLSALIEGRVSLNLVAGHSPEEQGYYGDFLSHDERYRRTSEFLTVCRAFWAGGGEVNFDGRYYRVRDGKLNTPFVSRRRRSPEIYVGGHSAAVQELAVEHADCWLCMGDAPAALVPRIRPVLERGTEIGLRLGVIARPTREEAVRDAYALIQDSELRRKEKSFVRQSDSVSNRGTLELAEAPGSEWLTPWLWAGAVPYFGAPAVSLVGSADDVAGGILELAAIGVSQFIFHGWPKLEEMLFFGREVLPRVRAREEAVRRSADA